MTDRFFRQHRAHYTSGAGAIVAVECGGIGRVVFPRPEICRGGYVGAIAQNGGPKERPVAWMVAVGHSFVLGMLARGEHFATLDALEARWMPFPSKRGLPLRKIDRFSTAGAVLVHSREFQSV